MRVAAGPGRPGFGSSAQDVEHLRANDGSEVEEIGTGDVGRLAQLVRALA